MYTLSNEAFREAAVEPALQPGTTDSRVPVRSPADAAVLVRCHHPLFADLRQRSATRLHPRELRRGRITIELSASTNPAAPC